MERKIGKTGLTQKEAVFEIIKKVLGPRYNPKVSVEQMFTRKVQGALRPTWNPREINPMIALVADGLRDGSIPSKYNSTSSKHQVNQYANRITHYWITHDKRLNGNKLGTRKSLTKKRTDTINHRLNQDPVLNGWRALQCDADTLEDELQLELYIAGCGFKIILESYGIDWRELPENVQHLLRLNHDDYMPVEKKEAA